MKESYDRAITPVESLFSLSPYSVVALVFRIKGDLDKSDLKRAIGFIRKKHPVLNAVIKIEKNGEKVFRTDLSAEIEYQVIEKKSDDDWNREYHKQCAIPFDFDKRPCIRFFLFQSEEMNDLMIFSHHIICDGLSLSYLGRDMLEYWGYQEKRDPQIVNPTPIDASNLPEDLKLNGLVSSVLKKMNNKFNADREYFDFVDYKVLHKSYWEKFTHEMISLTLTEEKTSSIIKSCKKHGVSVNSALVTALCCARQRVKGKDNVPNTHSIAVNVRDRLKNNPGNGMGFYAGGIDIPFIYKEKEDFWINAVRFQKIINKHNTNKKVFNNILNWSFLEPGIMESLNFKMLGSLTDKNGKIFKYSNNKDLVTSLARREKMDSLDNMIRTTAVTNLGNVDFKRKYGELELDSLIMNPGGAFPLAMVQLVVAACTVSGKLSLLIEYERRRLTDRQAQFILDLIPKFLLN